MSLIPSEEMTRLIEAYHSLFNMRREYEIYYALTTPRSVTGAYHEIPMKIRIAEGIWT